MIGQGHFVRLVVEVNTGIFLAQTPILLVIDSKSFLQASQFSFQSCGDRGTEHVEIAKAKVLSMAVARQSHFAAHIIFSDPIKLVLAL